MSKTIKIDGVDHHFKTNRQARPLWAYSNMPEKVRASEFDYVAADDRLGDDARFFEYRGSWYDLHDGFDVASPTLKQLGWSGVQPESAFSAVLVSFWDAGGLYLHGEIVVGYVHW